MSYNLRLHGIRHPSTASTATALEAAASSSSSQTRRLSLNRERSHSVQGRGPSPVLARSNSNQFEGFNLVSHEQEWTRRHSLGVAAKNADWAHYFLSTAASDTGITGILTFKNDPTRDAEYYFNIIPNAVQNQDATYKELLAVYNALALWGRRQQILKAKRVLLGVHHPEAHLLLRKARLTNKTPPAILMVLKEINDICAQFAIEYRIAELDPQITIRHTAPYLLLRLDEPECKKRMKSLIMQMTVDKGERFIIKERMFPPVYVA